MGGICCFKVGMKIKRTIAYFFQTKYTFYKLYRLHSVVYKILNYLCYNGQHNTF
jgi:hypothetical protein